MRGPALQHNPCRRSRQDLCWLRERRADRRILAAHYGKANMHELVSRLEKVANDRIDEIELDVD